METYTDYNFYKDTYKGNMSESDFDKLKLDVQMYIKKNTLDRIDIKAVSDEIKFAFCRIIDITYESEQKKTEMGNLKSQNVEGWQETYLSPQEIDKESQKEKTTILADYLWNVFGKDGNPLLYRGV